MAEKCEMCHLYYGENVYEDVRLFGMDNTPLCPKHYSSADHNYEAAVRDLNPEDKDA